MDDGNGKPASVRMGETCTYITVNTILKGTLILSDELHISPSDKCGKWILRITKRERGGGNTVSGSTSVFHPTARE